MQLYIYCVCILDSNYSILFLFLCAVWQEKKTVYRVTCVHTLCVFAYHIKYLSVHKCIK